MMSYIPPKLQLAETPKHLSVGLSIDLREGTDESEALMKYINRNY